MILLDSELRVAFAFAETLCDCAALQSVPEKLTGMHLTGEKSQKPGGHLSCCSALISHLHFESQSTD